MVSEDFTDAAAECKRFFDDNSQFRELVPKLSDYIDDFAERKDKNCNRYGYIILCLTTIIKVFHQAIDAEQKLIMARPEADRAKPNMNGKLTPILKYLELHRDTNEEVEVFKTEARNLRDMFEDVKSELEKLYKEIIQEMLHCAKEKENASILQGLTGLVGVGTCITVVASNPDIAFSLAGPVVKAYLASLGKNETKINEVMDRLDEARSAVLEAQISLQRFLTEVDLLSIKELYTEREFVKIIQGIF